MRNSRKLPTSKSHPSRSSGVGDVIRDETSSAALSPLLPLHCHLTHFTSSSQKLTTAPINVSLTLSPHSNSPSFLRWVTLKFDFHISISFLVVEEMALRFIRSGNAPSFKMLFSLASMYALMAILAYSVIHMKFIRPLGEDAPLDRFSEARAVGHVRVLAHDIGNRQVSHPLRMLRDWFARLF